MPNRIEHSDLSHLLLVIFCTCLLLGCQSDELDQGNASDEDTIDIPNKIMPLGASRVQGFSPWFESYRYELWKDLIDGGWEFSQKFKVNNLKTWVCRRLDIQNFGLRGDQVVQSIQICCIEIGCFDVPFGENFSK